MTKYPRSLIVITALLGTAVAAAAPPPAGPAIQAQVAAYKSCVLGMMDDGKFDWLSAYALCQGGNSVAQAESCLRNFAAAYPSETAQVGAFACARGAKWPAARACMDALNPTSDPSLTNTACAGGNSSAAALTCANEMLALGYVDVVAWIACAPGTVPKVADECIRATTALSDAGQSYYDVFAAAACSGPTPAAWAQSCVAYALDALSDLPAGQADRAAGFACSSMPPSMP